MSQSDDPLLTDRAAALVEAAIAAGADAADAVAVGNVAIAVEVRNGVAQESERAEGRDLGLRAFVGTRSAILSTNDLEHVPLADLAERAVATARAAPENPSAGLAAANRLAGEYPDLDLFDPTEAEPDTLIELAATAETAMLETPGVSKSGGAAASAGRSRLVLATSTGFSGTYVRTRFSVSATAICGDGTAMERDHDFTAATHYADLECAHAVGRRAAHRALRRLNPRQIETRAAPVILENRSAGSLVGDLAGAINGAAIVRGASFLADRLGKAISPDAITIIDDPTVRRGLASYPFDGEGILGQPLRVIDRGRLTTWLMDCATARQLDLESNGRAVRGISAGPSPATSNLRLVEGEGTLDDMIADAGTGLLVTSMFGRGVNLVTGDYSRGVAGLWFENGEIAYPVSEVTIAGHLDAMLGSLGAAGDPVTRGAMTAPSLSVGEMTIAGQ